MIILARPFTAYGDDSGKRKTPMVVAGGYVSQAAHWELLQRDWSDKVRKKGFCEFKRSDYDLKKYGNEFLFELGDLLHQHAAYGFACGVYVDDWRDLSKVYALELYHVVPYSICARTCIGLVRQWHKKREIRAEHMAYIFDKGSENAGELLELLKIDESEEARGISVTTDDSERIAGLQAADFLAWEVRNQYLRNPDPQSWQDLSPAFTHLLRVPFDVDLQRMPKFGVYSAEALEKLCKDTKIPLLKDIPDNIWALPKPIRLKWPPTKP